jgi:hypothetical protein
VAAGLSTGEIEATEALLRRLRDGLEAQQATQEA